MRVNRQTKMPASSRDVFVQSLTAGALTATLGAFLMLYTLSITGVLSLQVLQSGPSAAALSWIAENLGLSLPVFALIAVLFAQTIGELKRRIKIKSSVDHVAQADHLADIWISLFFGTGIIWTAIGMRNALLFALGDPAGTMEAGSFALLERMVDGGILVALSTTIFGGMGGYLMRVMKTVSVGGELKRYHATRVEKAAGETRETLAAMEQHLEQLAAMEGRGNA